ncbi:hypothetical protein FWP33_08875 [Vibrio parahaemolyticus]|jgi:hypothetical protein|uniref:Uncharacterized protein n=2 Tax=Vibrio harveyi group TaxID=717610 RepID=A0A9Q3YG83_VIBPH|nr:hypothetical protein [Vibrio parahaemolyticus]ELA8176688.1 hypothetical protein [Vibrio alginolyticus]CAH1598756.1 hypothetical protein THF1C08_50232 [Vibrio jasicida]EGQ9742631.1 hypothetical protein [Vibrio parahaemolyticus]EJC7176127.1 hypothetical protein [Vibrio parahaemolyticus]EJE4724566.1 hypothetical protein [Vibrio parahaemolyticus]
MKIGLIPAPSALAEDIDLLDIFSIEETFSCEVFKQLISEAKTHCDHSLIWVRGIGLHPMKYQTIPTPPSSDTSIRLTIHEIQNATCQNFPHVDLNTAEFIYFGDIENEIDE